LRECLQVLFRESQERIRVLYKQYYKVEISKILLISRYYKTHNTNKEAFDDLVNKNIDHELPIKNLIVVYPDYLEVELTQGGEN